MGSDATFWNGEPCEARRVTITMADMEQFEAYWGRKLVGTERSAVEVVYNDDTFYLDDVAIEENEPDGPGWYKVTAGGGSPNVGHREVWPKEGSVRPR